MKVNTQLPLYSIRKVTPITPLSNNVDKREEKKQEEYQKAFTKILKKTTKKL